MLNNLQDAFEIKAFFSCSCNANFVENELIAGLEWNLHGSQIDLTWWITFFDLSSQSWKSASPNTLVIHKVGSQDYWNFYNTFQVGYCLDFKKIFSL